MVFEVKDLSVKYGAEGFTLHELSFSADEGEIISIIGESGSGKTTLARAIVHMQDADAIIKGQVIISGKNIYEISEKELEQMRQRDFAIAFQNSRELLNPLLTLREQFFEILSKVYKSKEEMEKKAAELLEVVGLKKDVLDKYPRELSGGMLQRFLLISAVALNPKVVVLDEPTSSLDVASKHKIIHLIMDINKRFNIAFIVITHDFGLAEHISTKMMIFYHGHLVEQGVTTDILRNPTHPYTKGLINSSMDINLYKDVWGIRNVRGEDKKVHGCPFYPRCTQGIEICKTHSPHLVPHKSIKNRLIACNRGGIITVLAGKDIHKSYGKNEVLKGIDIDVLSSEVVSIVGVSGSGKTTLSGILAGYNSADSGEVFYEGEKADYKTLHRIKGGLQMIFQDPTSAINQSMTVYDAVAEPLQLNYPDDDISTEVKEALYEVGLPEDEAFCKQKIKSLSGGQQQRIVIARALTMKPRLLIADEPTSMLDPSSKANLIRRIKRIQNRKGLSVLMITHDLSCAMKISDKIFMLEEGKLRRIENIADLNEEFKAAE